MPIPGHLSCKTAQVPQREPGMTPYEMMLSESQERMLLVAEKGREQEVLSVFKKWGLDATQIGVVTDDGMLRVKQNGVVFAEIPNRALADEAPRYNRPFSKPLRTAPIIGPPLASKDLTADLKALLSSGDLCSKRWIWEQYDYQVRTIRWRDQAQKPPLCALRAPIPGGHGAGWQWSLLRA